MRTARLKMGFDRPQRGLIVHEPSSHHNSIVGKNVRGLHTLVILRRPEEITFPSPHAGSANPTM